MVQRDHRDLVAQPTHKPRCSAREPRLVDDEQHEHERVLQVDVLNLGRRRPRQRGPTGPKTVRQRPLKAGIGRAL